ENAGIKDREHGEGRQHCEGQNYGGGRGNGNKSGSLEYLMKEYGRACEEIQEMASLINDTAPLKRLSSPEKPSF
ncbi:hypothetical protein, partial [Eggerthella lenta]